MSDVVGWVITPDEIKARMQALDTLVRELDAAIKSSSSNKVNASFRSGYAGFLRRWVEFASAYSAWSPRLFARRWEPRYLDFVSAYDRWSAMYDSRRLPHETMATPATPAMRDLSDDVAEAGAQMGAVAADLLEPISGSITATSIAVIAVAALAGLWFLKK